MGKVLWVLAIIGATLVGLAYMGSQVNSQPRLPSDAQYSCSMLSQTHAACEVTLPADVAAQPVPPNARDGVLAGLCRSLDARPDGAWWKANGTYTVSLLNPDGSTYYQTTVAPGSCP